ncbi:hypothetical protein [Viscerimonas tarda]
MTKVVETRTLVVVKRFIDKHDKKTWHEVGKQVEFEKERAEDVVKRGLAEEVVIEG